VTDRWHNGRTGVVVILVLNVVLDTAGFMRTRGARISILARHSPETGYVDADRIAIKTHLADGAGHTFYKAYFVALTPSVSTVSG